MTTNNKSPWYYVRRRFFRNRPAVIGGFVILVTVFIVMLGNLIKPDGTPNMTAGDASIKKKTPVFEVFVLRFIKHREVSREPFLERLYIGQESPYRFQPVSEYEINRESGTVSYSIESYHHLDKEEYPLIKAMRRISESTEDVGKVDSLRTFTLVNDSIRYVTTEGKIRQESLESLVNEFEENNVEERIYWLGTTITGQDMLSHLLHGMRISLLIGIMSVLISLFIGIPLGALAGYYGGRTDNFISWLMTVIWSIPGVMLVIVISMALDSDSLWVIYIAVGLTTWVEVARIVRGEIMQIKQKQYVEAARAFGVSNSRLIYRHIIPNMLGPIIVIATANFSSAILIEAGLSFIGLGVKPPEPSLGQMVYAGFEAIGSRHSWHLALFPGMLICILVLAFNLLGNGLRDAFDPKGKEAF